ncbi:MAG: PKD domain-containing protein [Acidobacteria bacterium]|nr:PKD domain-containing protein [Acidobacteriota bacterium]
MLSLMGGLFGLVLLAMPERAVAGVEAKFEYGCEPRASTLSELTCTFDGSTSTSTDGPILGYRWYFRRYSPEDRESETATRTGVRVTHTYTQARARRYTYYATLEVTDALGNKHLHTEQVDPSRRMDFPPENQRPTADFSFVCNFLDCVFDGSASIDPDGSIVSYSWNFGDGNTANGDIVPHSFAAAGSYTVYLTVADNAGATGIRGRTITVAAQPPEGFLLTATGVVARGGVHTAQLRWTGATSPQVDIFRNGILIATLSNSGSYNDNTGQRGRGTYSYWVCESGTNTCSNSVTLVFE